jgi:23S rRNA (guanosine2251-2'-O)-methyltransferase
MRRLRERRWRLGAGARDAEASEARGGAEYLYGVHPVAEALRARRRAIHVVHLRERPRARELERIAEEAARAGVAVREVDPERLARLAGAEARTQGVVAEVGPLPEFGLPEVLRFRPSGDRWLVALDGVEDPQNVGAIARVAEASGALGLVLTERRAPPLSPAVSKASAGAIEFLPVARVKNLGRALAELKRAGFWVLGADAEEGMDLYAAPDAQLRGDLVLVLGAEGRGLRPGVRAALDHRLRIPMAGQVRSLNVSAAAAVVLFEWLRRSRGEHPSNRGR